MPANAPELIALLDRLTAATPAASATPTNAAAPANAAAGKPSAPVAVIGSMNADYTVVTERLPRPGETVTAGPLRVLPGGKSGNQAASAARLGADVRMFGAVGSDANADFLLGELGKAGVDTCNVLRAQGASGTTVITVDAHGENTIVYSPGSNALVSADYVVSRRDALAGARVLGLCLESPIDTVTAAARLCHDAGVTVLLNNSPFVPAHDLPADLVAATDILLVNEHEMAMMLDVEEPANGRWIAFDWQEALAGMAALGFPRAIVTLGAEGSVVLDADSGVASHIDPVTVDAVDTTGCGDAFMGTVLAGLAAGFDLRDAVRLASAVSAYAATGQGAQASYGSADRIRDWLVAR
ncbi:ribokinase [Bifidobacterium vespertilionis]|uniref:ribokinase n=1 Tax=Bifidobacterium vespertilionis TaxID=2562524 RepID=UPI001BDC8E1C|nr:ribokinase [Bifidobacterium vespertilionis]MBT1179318.1 ribokinase [Bifidobacterium vespertilionis]